MFRDWRRHEDPEIDERPDRGLAAVSGEARRRGHPDKVTRLSGLRSKRSNDMPRAQGTGAASSDLHIKRRALDSRIESRGAGEFADYAPRLQAGGVGALPQLQLRPCGHGGPVDLERLGSPAGEPLGPGDVERGAQERHAHGRLA